VNFISERTMATRLVFAVASVILWQPAQAASVYVPVNAPYAQDLLVKTASEHPELQKLGLHAIPPGQKDYAIIANPITSKIGKKSSEDDLAVLHSGKPSVKRNEKGSFYDLCLPISDAAGRPLGITVMEIPFASAKDTNEALAKATAVRDELQKNIPDHDKLFDTTTVPLKPMQTIALATDVKGRFDHVTADVMHNRLFMTAEDTQVVPVIDAVNGKQTGEIKGLGKPHAILYREDLNRLYVTDGDAGALKMFDGATFAPLGSIPLEKDADSIGYDPNRKYLYIANGGKDAGGQHDSLVSVVDTTTGTKITDIRIPSETLEAMALDVYRPRLYLNNRAQNQVAVIDRWKNTVLASWPVTLAKDNVAMALDEPHQRLFVGCRSGQVVVFDTNTGKELQAIPINTGIDDLQYDVATKRLYAIGGGSIDVLHQVDADHYESLGTVPVGGTAKTGRLVPEMNRYFAAVPTDGANPPVLQSLQPLNIPVAKVPKPEQMAKVDAPLALKIDYSMLSAHPYLRKLGLHAIPPGGTESVIIANGNMSRIGAASSKGDFEAIQDGKTYCAKKDDGAYYNIKMPLKDATGKSIGILVMEMPYTSASDEADAIRQAEAIRQDVAQQIPDSAALFKQ
jgi:DNA-binding beta-propeller fold protein YncE